MTEHHIVAIMQPYFLPYIGYWQLIKAADEFVLYDTIEYTKKGWINRNRFLMNGQDKKFSLALKSNSDYLPVNQRFLAENFDRQKLLRQFQGAYAKASFYKENFPLIEEIIMYEDDNLFGYIHHSIGKVCEFLGIDTPITLSSSIASGHEEVKGKDKVVNICKARNASRYINPIGGVELYDKDAFQAQGLDLEFIKARILHYDCFGQEALPHMSILDVMMFNDRETIQGYLQEFDRV